MPDVPDPFLADLDELGRLYQLLAGKVEPGQGEGGRRPQPGSRPPLQIPPVSLMHEIRSTVSYYIAQARWTLQPVRRVNITDRTKTPDLPDGARCPWCGGELVAWFRDDSTEPAEVVCLDPQAHTPDEFGHSPPARWGKADWPRLGVLTGVREDRRFTTLRQQADTG